MFWYISNYATSVIVRKDSSKTHLHNLAIGILGTSSANNINLDTFCIPQDSNKEANDKNNKCSRLNSKYLYPNIKPVNPFSSDCSNENNLAVPPIFFIPKVNKHFLASEFSSRAILVCPYWVCSYKTRARSSVVRNNNRA